MIPRLYQTAGQYLLYLCMAVVPFLFNACGKTASDTKPKHIRFSSNQHFFEARSEAKYADGFSLSYHSNYKLLKVLNPYQDNRDTLQYLLKPRNVELDTSEGPATEADQVIEVPVRSIIATSTTHVALTDALQANEIVSGMAGARYVYNSGIRARLKKGTVVSFSEGEFNMEQALALDPDLVMLSAGQSSRLDDYNILRTSGIGVFINSEWLETTPLGKAEWIKVMGALLNKEAMANNIFQKVEKRYLELREKTKGANLQNKPVVINNMPYKGAWFVSGGGSFEASLLRDAGADYPWFDEKATGGLRKDFEHIYKIGLEADVWLNPGAATSKAEILQKDSRFRDFEAFQTGRIYNNNRRMSPSGGNDYWESGVVHPERILADLIHILHPDLLENHELYYYQKLNGNDDE